MANKEKCALRMLMCATWMLVTNTVQFFTKQQWPAVSIGAFFAWCVGACLFLVNLVKMHKERED